MAVAVVLAVVGTALFKTLQAHLVESDHQLLQRQARWLLMGDLPVDQGERLKNLRYRLDMLNDLHPDLRTSMRTEAVSDTAKELAAAGHGGDSPVWTVMLDGQEFDTVDLEIPADGLFVTQVRLMAPVAPRQAELRYFGWIILVAGCAGIVIAAALSVPGMRWSGRRLRQLSREAHAANQGGRLSMTSVDAELVELVQAFNSTLDQREAVFRQSEAFSADVAHELRSPLATLIGGTQLALSRQRSSEELRDALASNLEELERLKKLVNDMLFLARADRGESAESLERADLGALADAMIHYCSALLDEADLTAVRVGTATAICNEALIRRAMANLLSNAIRHAQGERSVELHIQALPGRVRIWVFNAGLPIPEEVAERIFDRFFRANASRSDHTSRHGLGLAIVHAIARMHGGNVFMQVHKDGNSIGFEIPSALASAQVRVRDAVQEAPR